jgi:hypothetical protein
MDTHAFQFYSPTHRTAPDNKIDRPRLEGLVREAEKRLLEEFTSREIGDLIEKIKTLADTIDTSKNLDGQILFVNKEFAEVVNLPFPVRERVIIDHNFASRDLILGLNKTKHYYTLVLSLNATRLFECFQGEFEEVKQNGFPFEHSGTLVDPTTTSGVRDDKYREHYNVIDKAFNEIHKQNPMKLVLCGVERNLSFYRTIADNKQVIFAEVEGNYDKTSVHDLAKKVWEIVLEKLEKEEAQTISELEQAVTSGNFVSGINQCWRLANEGRVRQILVEKGYHQAAIMNEDGELNLTDDAKAPGVVDDIVDETVEAALKMGGAVTFLEDDKLTKFNKIAAILRY